MEVENIWIFGGWVVMGKKEDKKDFEIKLKRGDKECL